MNARSSIRHCNSSDAFAGCASSAAPTAIGVASPEPLRGEPKSVVIGRDGQEHLREAVDEAPDFIYLDLRLPGLDRFEDP